MNFAAVLKTIDSRLRVEGHPSVLVGGLALAAFGIPRATLDLDLLVPAEAQETGPGTRSSVRPAGSRAPAGSRFWFPDPSISPR